MFTVLALAPTAVITARHTAIDAAIRLIYDLRNSGCFILFFLLIEISKRALYAMLEIHTPQPTRIYPNLAIQMGIASSPFLERIKLLYIKLGINTNRTS